MRKVVIMVLLSVLAVCSNVSAASDETPVKPVVAPINVTVNGELFCFGELQPIIKYGRMLVPLKSDLFEKFSATTEYDHIYKEIVIRTHTHILTLYTDQLVIYNKGEKSYLLDVEPMYINEHVYVPLRGFIEVLGMTIEYDGNTNTAKIT